MTPFQFTRTGFVLLGTYFVLAGLASAVGIVFALQDLESGRGLGWRMLSAALPTVLLTSIPGWVLIAKSGALADRIWPDEDEGLSSSTSAQDLARIGVALLGLYFVTSGVASVIGGLTLILSSRSNPMLAEFSFLYQVAAHGVASMLFGGLLFFQAHRLARLLIQRA